MFARKHVGSIENQFGHKLKPTLNSFGSKLIKAATIQRHIINPENEKPKKSYLER